jgi:hypothetical protein
MGRGWSLLLLRLFAKKNALISHFHIALLLVCVSLRGISAEPFISFRNDVMPVLAKAGCNAGTCHGNKYGKGGFKLSLRGQDPDGDYEALVFGLGGRRVSSSEPDASLVLLKPTAQVPHEGGHRFDTNSLEYQTLRRWIAQRMPNERDAAPKLTRIEVAPLDRVVVEPAHSVQLSAKAFFSDGTSRDITRTAVYEPANNLVKVSHDGLVKRENDRPGETTVLVRFLDQQVPVRLAFIPNRKDFKWAAPRENNFIDRHVFAKLRSLRVNPSELSDDAVFARRAYLDLLGILPTSDEARAFIADTRRDKRARFVQELLDRPEFAEFWAIKWGDLTRNEEKTIDRKGVQAMHRWVQQSIATNKSVDQFVREIISARGSTYQNPAANYYRALRDPITRAEATAQVFLGVRLQCAQCHNHPFDRWSQDDYYDWASVFSRVSYKVLENKRADNLDTHEFKGEQIVYLNRDGVGAVTNTRNGKLAAPRFLGAKGKLAAEADPLDELARWVTSNPLFAKSQVNRVWFHLMGRGIVDPIDDFRPTNPPSHPELLDELTKEFVAHKFDLRWLITTIMNSRAYQLSAEPNETNADDELNYSHVLPRRLTAEQLLDAQHEVLGVPTKFNGYPPGMRAGQLPGVEAVRLREKRKSSSDTFLTLFGKPMRLLSCECERSSETTMNQAFNLISGPEMNELLSAPDNRLTTLLASGKPLPQIIEELYWSALTRAPSTAESAKAVAHVERAEDKRKGLEDIAWTLLNAKEFVLRR